MHRVFEDYFIRLEVLHASVEKAIAGLPPSALDYVPGPDMNSLTILVTHLAGAERYWIGDVAGQEPSGRIREKEFQARGMVEADLRHRLAEVLAHSRSVLERLSLNDLDAERTSERDGRTMTVAEALFHALEHTGLHTGQIQITRQLVDARREAWYTFSAPGTPEAE